MPDINEEHEIQKLDLLMDIRDLLKEQNELLRKNKESIDRICLQPRRVNECNAGCDPDDLEPMHTKKGGKNE